MIIRLFLMIMMILSSHYYEKKWRWHGCVCLCSKCTYEKKNIRTLDCSFFSLLLLLLVFVGGRIVVVFVWNFFFVREKQNLNIFFGHQILLDFYCMNYEEKLIKFDHKIDRLIDYDFVYINLIESQSSDYYYYYHRSIINIDIRHWEMSMCHIYWIECMSKILLKLWTHDDDDDDEIIYLFVEIWSVDSVCFLLISINFKKK